MAEGESVVPQMPALVILVNLLYNDGVIIPTILGSDGYL